MGVEEWWDKWNVCGGIAWSEEWKVSSEREWVDQTDVMCWEFSI